MTQAFFESRRKLYEKRDEFKRKGYTESEIREIENDMLERHNEDYDIAEYRFRLKQAGHSID